MILDLIIVASPCSRSQHSYVILPVISCESCDRRDKACLTRLGPPQRSAMGTGGSSSQSVVATLCDDEPPVPIAISCGTGIFALSFFCTRQSLTNRNTCAAAAVEPSSNRRRKRLKCGGCVLKGDQDDISRS